MARATSSAVLSTVTISPPRGSVLLSICRVCAWPGRSRTPLENLFRRPRRPAPAAFYLGDRQSGPLGQFMQHELTERRRWYAQDLQLRAPIRRHSVIAEAFATVPRERFLGPRSE